MRTSKVMMHFGPVECRSYFLDQKVTDLLSHLPIDVVRFNDHRKRILAQAFSDILPEFLLPRISFTQNFFYIDPKHVHRMHLVYHKSFKIISAT